MNVHMQNSVALEYMALTIEQNNLPDGGCVKTSLQDLFNHIREHALGELVVAKTISKTQFQWRVVNPLVRCAADDDSCALIAKQVERLFDTSRPSPKEAMNLAYCMMGKGGLAQRVSGLRVFERIIEVALSKKTPHNSEAENLAHDVLRFLDKTSVGTSPAHYKRVRHAIQNHARLTLGQEALPYDGVQIIKPKFF